MTRPGRRMNSFVLFTINLLIANVYSFNCENGGKLTQEIEDVIFPPQDSAQGNNNFDDFFVITMNDCKQYLSSAKDSLVFYGSACTSVPLSIESIFSTLTKVSIKWTNLTVIDEAAFIFWDGVSHLAISENPELTKISDNAFGGLSFLEKLEINDNPKLEFLNEKTFDGLNSLKELSLAGNNFKRISDVTKSLAITSLSALGYLDLSSNPFTSMSQNDFSPMIGTPVETLTMTNLNLNKTGPKPLVYFRKLKKLTLGAVYPSDVYSDLLENLNENKDLNEIILNNFDFKSNDTFADIIDGKLNKITITGSKFNALTVNRRSYTLGEIDISDSYINEFPTVVFDPKFFSNITKIILKNNRLTYLPENIPTSNAKLLDLSGNNFITLKKNNFYFAPKLELLVLSDCNVKNIEDNAFEKNSELILLDLSRNDFHESIGILNKNTFNGLSNLKVLDLSNSKIMELKDKSVFQGLTNLQLLSLKNNRLKNLNVEVFEPLKCLRKIDLRNNKFIFFDPKLLTNNALTDVGLFENIYKVDQDLIRFINLLRLTNKENSYFTGCSKISVKINGAESETIGIEINESRNDLKCEIILTKEPSSNDTQSNATGTDTDDDQNNLIYILLKPQQVYETLSLDGWSIFRFLYVFIFYILLFALVIYLSYRLMVLTKRYRKNRRQPLILDEKIDYCGVENRTFAMPYEKMEGALKGDLKKF